MLEGIRVLVVEDDADSREVFALALTAYGATVVAEASVAGAIEALGTDPPDVVICDVVFPDGDGYGLLEALGAREGGAGTPLIAVTGLDPDFCDGALARGFAAYVQKPCDLAELAGMVERLGRGARSPRG